MNKLFTKIAALALGVTMATGVGVAVATNSREASPASAAGTTIPASNLSSSSTCTVSGTAGVKANKGVAATITVPKAAGDCDVTFHAAAWNGEGVAHNVTYTNATCSTSSITLTADTGVSGSSSSYTLAGSESTYEFTVSLTQTSASSDMVINIAGVSNKRFVVWGASYVSGGSDPVAVTGVSLNKNALSLTVGGSETLTATITPSDATNKNVTWSTSNSSVATVSNGEVSAVAAGNATITVTTQDGNKTATCAVTVSAPVYSQFEKITAVSGLVAGKKYVIGNAGGTAFMSSTQNTNNRGQTSGTVSNNKVTETASMEVIELGGTTGAWTLHATKTAGYLSSNSSSSNNLKTESTATSDKSKWTITFSNSTPSVQANYYDRKDLRYNSGSSIFSCYSSGGQAAISLWKEVSSTPSYTIEFDSNGGSAGTIEDISVEKDSSFIFPSPGTKMGYIFDGWTSTGSAPYYAAGSESSAVTTDVSYTAHWTLDETLSVSLSEGTFNKTYYTDGDWDWEHLTVTYTSTSGGGKVPTNLTASNFTFTPSKPSSVSTTSVQVYVTYDNVQSNTITITDISITERTPAGGIVDGGKYVIVSSNGYILPSAAEITTEPKNVASYTSSMKNDEDYCWTFDSTGVFDHYTITNSLGTTLIHVNDNDGVRTSTSGTSSADFEVSEVGENITISEKSYKALYLVAYGRYLTQYTANTSWRCYSNANTNGTSKVALIPYETPDVLDPDLTLTGEPVSLTAGSTFPGVTKAEAEYSETGSKDVTSSVVYTLGGDSISVGDTIPVSKVGNSVEIVVSYTDENDDSASASFSVPVNYKPVTSIGLDKSSATVAKGGTVQLTATVSDSYAIQTVKWTTSDSSIATVSAATSASGNAITVTGSSSNAGSATITAYVDENDNGSLDSGEKSATCAITVSGDPVLNMLDDGENVISGQSLHAFTTDSNIYLYVDAQNFVGAITYSWSSSNTNAIAIVEEADEMCEFEIAGAGTNVRLSCHAVGATSGDLTTYVDYTITEPQVDEVTWSAPATLSVYDNASLTAATITSWSPAYHKDNGESGSISSEYTVKLGGTTISLSHPWDVEDDGEELWIEYGGVASSHVTVQVTEHLNAINYQVWSKVTDDSDLEAGDVIVIGEDTKGKFMTGDSGSMSSGNLATVAGTVTDGVVTDMPSDAVRLTLGGSSGAWTLKNSAGEYLSITTTNSRHLQFVESSVTLGISIDDSGNATISSSSGTSVRILLNNSANPARFSTYNSQVSDSMLLPEIYKNSSSNIADTNATAQRALLGYVATFNSTMNCDDGGATTNVESKWSSASSAFTTAMNALGTDDKAVFKRLVANASAVEGGDSLQDMLARYDYIIAKYKLSNDFLHDGADRGAVQYAKVSPLSIVVDNGNAVAIIMVISLVSVTCIGGYFFLKKRKEQ